MDLRDEIKSITKQIKKTGDVDLHKKIFDVQAEIFILFEENKNKDLNARHLGTIFL